MQVGEFLDRVTTEVLDMDNESAFFEPMDPKLAQKLPNVFFLPVNPKRHPCPNATFQRRLILRDQFRKILGKDEERELTQKDITKLHRASFDIINDQTLKLHGSDIAPIKLGTINRVREELSRTHAAITIILGFAERDALELHCRRISTNALRLRRMPPGAG